MSITANFKLLLIIPLLIAASPAPHPGAARTCDIVIVNKDGLSVPLRAEIADTEGLRLAGLMHRKELGRNYGMLFVFDREQMLRFWMKNTSIPLSIAYISRDGRIMDILDMRPFDISVTYPSPRPALYALEVNRGWFKDNRIVPGCALTLDGCLGK